MRRNVCLLRPCCSESVVTHLLDGPTWDGLLDQDGCASWSFNSPMSLLEVVPPQGILGASEKGQGFGGLVQIRLRDTLLLRRCIVLSWKQAFFDFSKGSGAYTGHQQQLFWIALGCLFNGGNAISRQNSPKVRRQQALQSRGSME